MVSSRMLLLGASCWLLVVLGRCEEPIEERSAEYDAIETQEEKELVSFVCPTNTVLTCCVFVCQCDAGEQCAIRKASRIGKLCGCPGGTVCNFSVLKCL
uniref:Uncharacterized protein n=1 Tax=Neolamprologus brichardi TaxID=32507 RepID=A0A3Q4HGI2_NEOBR